MLAMMSRQQRKRPQFNFLDKLEGSRGARIFVSILLGLGIASLFRLTCSGEQCKIIRGPPMEEVQKNVYKINDSTCYQYSPVPAKCHTAGGGGSFDSGIEKSPA